MNSKDCFHCGDPVPRNLCITSTVDNEEVSFCCYGCQAIADFIRGEDLSQYYRHRSRSADNPSNANTEEYANAFTLLKDEDVYPLYVHIDNQEHHIQLSVDGMTCSACAWLIEKHISSLDGVVSMHINLSNSLATLIWDPSKIDINDINHSANSIGYYLKPYRSDGEDTNRIEKRKSSIIKLGIAGVGMMQVMMSAIALYAGDIQGMEDSYKQLLRWASFCFSTPVVLFSASPFFNAALRDLKTRHFTMDLPVSIGIGLAYISSVYALFIDHGHVYFDSVTMFTFFLLLGRFLEEGARHKSLKNNTKNDELSSVILCKNDQPLLYPKSKLTLNDIIQVAPGESLPTDGVIVDGHTNIDESSLTGEYLPVAKSIGDVVTASTTNIDQTIKIKVTAIGTQTRAAAIERLTQRALSEKPKIAVIADKIAHYFVICVLLVAVLAYGTWYFIDQEQAYWIMVSVLVVTCPCALSLATPVALTTATNKLKEYGLVITRGHVIESLAKCQHIAFDKTGTLTYGKFDIVSISNIDSERIVDICSALEQGSIHPIAKAFQSTNHIKANKLVNHTGLGVEGEIDGAQYRLGNQKFIQHWCQDWHDQSIEPNALTLFLATESAIISRIVLQDRLRSETQSTVQNLRNAGFTVSLLTGDTKASALSVLCEEDFDAFITDQTPEDKWQWLSKKADLKRTIMVGDGLNDVPSLAGASTSIAMGQSSDLAKTHADALLLSNDISTIYQAILLAKKCQRIIKQNLFWAASYNGIMLPAALLGLIPPWSAAIGMAASSLLVVLNATRLSK
ncbi:heavy metal translocating P-type ATPase [Marinomonas sp. 15G1-11]|uniref:Heavy metal translocating P-type ATPase n=1 Tax=Marinomonas phaeophyticola TaxID=3004091 RepID=A0ABT4JRU6_9GAMM|nr:heavy metal translocating P-type ATPase [Marinomonas sp. 15G1-11]MCZ2720314.1 heavy metal translocating P-type ATPase [Marinomonas sp. 15G1-11]